VVGHKLAASRLVVITPQLVIGQQLKVISMKVNKSIIIVGILATSIATIINR